jgi:hypothetical protein
MGCFLLLVFMSIGFILAVIYPPLGFSFLLLAFILWVNTQKG